MVTIADEAFGLLCGDLLGEGCSRKVYACTLLPDCVVKVEETVGSFENAAEWLTWRNVAGAPAERWFAPCRWISESGSILVMQRTHPARLRDLPDRVPPWACIDLKPENWGLIGDRAVCHDYGSLSSRVLATGTSTRRMMKAKWITQ